jgi:glycosyltransferase involved in cell wall biosynthesis
MKISCLMVSHNKPGYVDCAIQGVLDQKHTDWELLVMDSGVLYDQNYFSKWKDERIKFIRSSETDETRKNKAMAPWCFNQTLKAATGDLITYHGDDDLLYENAFDVFNRWMTNNKKMLAIYASIDLAFYVHGEVAHVYGQRKAFEIGGSGAYSMDCRVDSL